MRHKLTLISVTSLAICMAANVVHAKSKTYGKTKGWTVFYNVPKQSCTAIGRQDKQGTSLGFAWFFRTGYWSVGLYNRRWTLQKGTKIPASVYIDNRLLVRRDMRVASPRLILLTIAKKRGNESNIAFREFQNGNSVRFNWAGGNSTRANLYGTKDALAMMARCAGKMAKLIRNRKNPAISQPNNGQPSIGQPSATQPQRAVSSNTTGRKKSWTVARPQALGNFRTLMAGMPNLRYTIVPPKPGREKTVNFTLPTGQVGKFFAFAGRTTTADKAMNSVISVRQKNCPGELATVTKRLPSTDGSVIRRVKMLCKITAQRSLTTTTMVIWKPSGLLMVLSISGRTRAPGANGFGTAGSKKLDL